ncbi:MAG: hypothetical protein RIC14_12875 [Filomicrobium sp.]
MKAILKSTATNLAARAYERALLLLSALVLLWPAPVANAADVGALIKQLDRTEWEIVKDEVSKRLPNLIATKQEQDALKSMLQSSQKIAAFAEAVQSDDYVTVQKISTQFLADNLEDAMIARFGSDSRVARSIELLKNDRNRALAKKLTRAALNLDTDDARIAIRDYLTEHATARFDKLKAEGEQLLKDTLLEVIPGSGRMVAMGFNPVDIYIQQVKDFTKFTAATRLRFNDAVLNCQAELYATLRQQNVSHDNIIERLEVYGSAQGKSGLKCGSSSGPRTTTGSWVDFFTRLGSGAAGQGELGLTPRNIADLARHYQQQRPGVRQNQDFAEWVREQLLSNVKLRAREFRDDLAKEQSRIARKRRQEQKQVVAALEAAISRLDKKKPAAENKRQPRDKKKPSPRARDRVASNDTPDEEDKKPRKRDNDKEPDTPKSTKQCDALRALVRKAGRSIGLASPSKTTALIANINSTLAAAKAEGNCPSDVYADAASAQSDLQNASALRDQLQTAITLCNIDALRPLKARASRISTAAFDIEVTLLQTAKTGVTHFEKGKSQFDAGQYESAKNRFQQALSALRELPPPACAKYQQRAKKGLENIAKIEAQQAIVDRAINTCNIKQMKKILKAYNGRKLHFFIVSIQRVQAALPKCKKNERIIAEGRFCEAAKGKLNNARSDYKANRLKASYQTLTKLDQQLTAKNTTRCSDLKPRIQDGLRKISILQAEHQRLSSMTTNCNVSGLKKLRSHYRGKKHPWYRNAAVHTKNAIKQCQRTLRQQAVADCKRQARDNGKVHAKIEKNRDGTYTCYSCEPGHTYRNGRCLSAEAMAYADCRKQARANKKVLARVEHAANGQYRCHWCERGQIYATDGRCWNPAALAEARCRYDVARMGKVYARSRALRNGQYHCQWCEPGTYYRNGRCFSPQQNISQGVAAINGILNELQRNTANRRQTGRRATPSRRPPARRTQPTRRTGNSRPPPNCIKDGFINMTDPRCKSHW